MVQKNGNVNQSIVRGYNGIELEFDGEGFNGGGTQYVDCECGNECCSGGFYEYIEPEVTENEASEAVYNIFGRHVDCVSDCSVKGPELNFHPMTYEYIVSMKPQFERMFQWMRNRNINSLWDNDCNAGMHIHMCYTMFDSDDHLKRFAQLIENLWDDVFEFSQRDSEYYCAPSGLDTTMSPAEFREQWYKNYHDRKKFQAINTMHEHTAEVRIFRAPDTWERYIANVQFCIVMLRLSRARRIQTISWKNVQRMAAKMAFSELSEIIG